MKGYEKVVIVNHGDKVHTMCQGEMIELIVIWVGSVVMSAKATKDKKIYTGNISTFYNKKLEESSEEVKPAAKPPMPFVY